MVDVRPAMEGKGSGGWKKGQPWKVRTVVEGKGSGGREGQRSK